MESEVKPWCIRSNVVRLSLIVPLMGLITAGSAAPAARSLVEAPAASMPPRLAVLIVIDGLTSRQFSEFSGPSAPRSLRKLLAASSVNGRASYGYAATYTAPGHATLATGVHPSTHGVCANSWIDPASGHKVYCVEDSAYPVLGDRLKDRSGISPKHLLADTFGDRWKASRPETLYYAVAAKDRSAVLLAGRRGEAYFFSDRSARFVTSRYYRHDYPAWWRRYYARSERAAPGARRSRWRSNILTRDEATLAFVRELIASTGIGAGSGRTDVLAVGFSALDAANHRWGPESPESAWVLRRLSIHLAELIEVLEGTAGPSGYVLALTSDHGFSRAVEPSDRVDGDRIAADLDGYLKARYGVGRAVRGWAGPLIYLDRTALSAVGADPGEAAREAVRYLRRDGRLRNAYTASDLLAGQGPRHARRSLAPSAGGDVYLLQRPGTILVRSSEKNTRASHGTPYAYDARVPVVYYGLGRPAPSSTTEIAAALEAVGGAS
ncbi:MAG: Alkaline phosphatase PhoK [Candidatus Omnitrophica bacterium]|nr:Alkaline phosphatase PhoK [Candidatus Omnitrophota bacterium]